MEDKRIQKTKRNLKKTLASLLGRKPFESITVTELCESAETSRITFYTHYNDKYDLADEMISDMVSSAVSEYEVLQKENNPDNNLRLSAENVLEVILNLYARHQSLFSHVSRAESPYLFQRFYQNLQHNVQLQAQKLCEALSIKRDFKRLAAFLCDGMLGFIMECKQQKCPFDTIRKEAKELLNRLLGAAPLLSPA